jgi:hypothetical protein
MNVADGCTNSFPLAAVFSTLVEFLLAIDLFFAFRFMLATVVTIYVTILTAQSLWGWYVWLAGSDKYISLLRRYILVQGLRLRFKAFWGDVIICMLLTVAFFMLWRAQNVLDYVDRTLSSVNETTSNPYVSRPAQH